MASNYEDALANYEPPRPNISPVNSYSQKKLLVVVNSSGRQASSVIRIASAVGYRVRGQLRNIKKNASLSAELASLKDVELVEGSLEDPVFVDGLFDGADLAFINTTPYGWTDEVVTGKRLADSAKKAGVEFYVYSGLTDHSKFSKDPLPALPLWSTKYEVEEYIREIGIPAAFPYVGCYHNNFSSRPYPLWQLTPIPDGSFEWRTPFPADVGIPFIDTEHDLGAAVIQILKDGPGKWNGKRYVLSRFFSFFDGGVQWLISATESPSRLKSSPRQKLANTFPAGYRDRYATSTPHARLRFQSRADTETSWWELCTRSVKTRPSTLCPKWIALASHRPCGRDGAG